MSRDERIFLVNMKVIYQHGISHSKNSSKLSQLLAIHNCHYVVEQTLREYLRDQTFEGGSLHESMGFDKIIKKANDIKNIPNFDNLLELNTIRNNAEHFFILPSADDVRAYAKIVENFLKWSFEQYFKANYDTLNLEDRIYDVPIRKVMLDAKNAIETGDLIKASQKMYEGLGAFKFMWFQYLSDIRVMGIAFMNQNQNVITFTNLLADLAFKIILGEDLPSLRKLMSIGTDFFIQEGTVGVKSQYPTPQFKDKEEASQDYADILNIILTYQDRVPQWRES